MTDTKIKLELDAYQVGLLLGAINANALFLDDSDTTLKELKTLYQDIREQAREDVERRFSQPWNKAGSDIARGETDGG